MCHAILRVKYQSDKTAAKIEVASEAEQAAKIDDLCRNDQVISIQIFARTTDVVLTKRWEQRKYMPPALPASPTFTTETETA